MGSLLRQSSVVVGMTWQPFYPRLIVYQELSVEEILEEEWPV